MNEDPISNPPSLDSLINTVNSLEIPKEQKEKLINEITALLHYYNLVLNLASSSIESALQAVNIKKEEKESL